MLFLLPHADVCDNAKILIFQQITTEGAITHEVIHATYKLLKVRGFELDDEEAWAYLGGYLTEKYYEYLRENDPDLKSDD